MYANQNDKATTLLAASNQHDDRIWLLIYKSNDADIVWLYVCIIECWYTAKLCQSLCYLEVDMISKEDDTISSSTITVVISYR